MTPNHDHVQFIKRERICQLTESMESMIPVLHCGNYIGCE
jgi:hypothetical protein